MINRIALLLGVVTLFLGCQKEDNSPGFEMVYQEEFTIPAGIGAFVTHHFYFKNLSTRYPALLDQYGKTNEDILRILTLQGALTGIFGDVNFNVVEEASLRVYQESAPNDYIEVAYRYPTPIEPSNTLDLIPSLADSKRIMANDRFSFDLALRLRNTTPDEMPTRLSLKLKANY